MKTAVHDGLPPALPVLNDSVSLPPSKFLQEQQGNTERLPTQGITEVHYSPTPEAIWDPPSKFKCIHSLSWAVITDSILTQKGPSETI